MNDKAPVFKARGYQWPIIDAALNKNVKNILCVMPRRCLSGETHIIMADGSFRFLKDIKPGDKILSWDGESFVEDEVISHWKTHKQSTYKIASPGYLPIISSGNHKFAFVEDGRPNVKWKEVDCLGKRAALLNYSGIKSGNLHNPDLAEFLGYMVADGYVNGYQQPKFTNTNEEILERVAELGEKLFGYTAIWRSKGNGYDLGFSNGTRGGGYTPNKIKEIFREDEKDVPKSKRRLHSMVWQFDEPSLHRFIAALIAADGSLFIGKRVFRPTTTDRLVPPGNEVSISCGACELYAWDIYWLMRRMGIVPMIPKLDKGSNWKIRVGKSSNIKKLLSCGYIYGKNQRKEDLLKVLSTTTKQTSIFKNCYRSHYKKEQHGEEELYDIETKNNHNFIANGYLVHNSGKDITVWNICIYLALQKTCLIYYILPTYSQAKKAIWQAISNDGVRFLDYVPESLITSINAQEMKITLKNNSIIQCIGGDSYNTSLVGSNPYVCVFSEFSIMDKQAYDYASPILAANDGICIMLYTPRGFNHAYRLHMMANKWPDWFVYHLTLNDTKHISDEALAKEREKHSEEFIQQEWFCFPAAQHVLTDCASKPIEEVVINDLIVTHTGRVRKVLGTVSRDYDGDLITIKSAGSYEDIVCTPNHPIRTYDFHTQSYSWKEAQHLTLNDRLVFPKKHLGSIPIISHELCMLIAWYITEGSCSDNKVQWTVKPEEAKRITDYLDKLNIEWKLIINDPVVNVTVYLVQLVDFFKSSCGLVANNKRLPFHLIATHEEEFLNELILGDGCLNTHKSGQKYIYTTVSKTLAYQVQLLANSLNKGYAASIYKRNAQTNTIQGRIVNCQESYCVSINFPLLRDKVSILIRAKNCIAAKIKEITRSPYRGKVYNLQVQYDESYLIAGRAVHNCSYIRGVEGAIYGRYMDELRAKEHICSVDWEPTSKVHTAWDLGRNKNMAVIFFQVVRQEIRIIDTLQLKEGAIPEYIAEAKKKPYIYGTHIGPHDIKVHDMGTNITRWGIAYQLGFNFEEAPSVGVENGIEATKAIFHRLWIDEKKCDVLIRSLDNYRMEWDEKREEYSERPMRDWTCHYSDALRYLAISLDKIGDYLTPEQLDQNFAKAKAMNAPVNNVFTNPFGGGFHR